MVTPDKAEDWVKKNYPDVYKSIYGEEPQTPSETQPPPKPKPEPPKPTQETTQAAPAEVLDLTAKTEEDFNVIRNTIIDFAEGNMISSLRDYDGSNITNIGIAREIWNTVSDEVKQNPSDDALIKLFDQYKIPYKR